MAEPLPEKSLITREVFSDREEITIPEIPRMGLALTYALAALVMALGQLSFLVFSFYLLLSSSENLTLSWGLIIPLAIYLLMAAVLFFLLYVAYLGLRKPYPQIITLKKDHLLFDSGADPVFYEENNIKTFGELYGHFSFTLWRRIKNARRRKYRFSLQQIATLTIRGPHKYLRLEIDEGLKRVEIAATVPEPEKAWLVRHIKQYYGLFAMDIVETQDEIAERILPDTTIQQQIDGGHEVLTIPARKRGLFLTLVFIPFNLILFVVWMLGSGLLLYRIPDMEPDGLAFALAFMVFWVPFGLYVGAVLYFNCRLRKPQIIRLEPQRMYFDSGASPLRVTPAYGELWEQIRFAPRKHYDFTVDQIATLRLTAIFYTNALAIKVGSKFVPLAEALTNVEREWLLNHIKNYYKLPREIE